MSQRIGAYIHAGELLNTRRNGLFGWIEFAQDYGVRIELTGNFSGELENRHIKFKHEKRDAKYVHEAGEFPQFIEDLADRQIGVVDQMEMREVQVPDLPIDEFLSLPDAQRPKHLVLRKCLYLSWYSQNGHITAEIIEPDLEIISSLPQKDGDTPEDFDEGEFEKDIEEFMIGPDGKPLLGPELLEDGEDEGDESDEDDDPYGLFSPGLDQNLAESLGPEEDNNDLDTADSGSDADTPEKSWDEVVPGIDPETKAMYEQWDEIFAGKKDQPITYLFRQTLKLPTPENVGSDEEAEPLVKVILAKLALLSVALDVCEHFSPLQTYSLLIKEILPTAQVHPNLIESEMVQHYSTSDYCSTCEIELDKEIEVEFGGEQSNDADDEQAIDELSDLDDPESPDDDAPDSDS